MARLKILFGNIPAIFSSLSASEDGTNLTVTFDTSIDLSGGVVGFKYGVNVDATWWVDVAGAVTNQSVVIALAELPATGGDTINIDPGYSLTNPAGAIVYASEKSLYVGPVVVAGGPPAEGSWNCIIYARRRGRR